MRILVLYGTRPEAIKLAPVIGALRERPDRFAVTVGTTAQHREMVDQVQTAFGLRPDLDLDLMRPAQTLNELASRAFAAVERVLVDAPPDCVVVQGDTTTAMVAAFAAFHRGVEVAHVEAGLRSGDLQHPFPEEANRRVVDLVSRWCFAPTARAAAALAAEGVSPERVLVTGNTVVDALRRFVPDDGTAPGEADEVLVTIHRRESFGEPLQRILAALRELAERFPSTRWVYPVHPNPNVRGPAHAALGGLANVELHQPFDYLELLRRLRRCRFALTDSGGIQEEGACFGRPVLVLRERTERQEGVEAGIAKLLGTRRERIVAEAARLLTDEREHRRMSGGANPYGDGRASQRIVAALAGEPVEPFVPAATLPR
jgi:UDP-N-acetylglucosamine 2-epimerase (non-hydrolysing)